MKSLSISATTSSATRQGPSPLPRSRRQARRRDPPLPAPRSPLVRPPSHRRRQHPSTAPPPTSPTATSSSTQRPYHRQAAGLQRYRAMPLRACSSSRVGEDLQVVADH